MSETIRFTEDILTVAKEKAQHIVSEAESETQQALDEAKKHMLIEAEDIVRNAQTEAEAVKRRRMSEVRHRLKLQEEQEKARILSEVVQETRKRILELTRDEDKYFPYLAGLVESGIRELGTENIVIHLNAVDLEQIDKGKLEREVTKRLGKPAKVEFSKEPIEALGGAIVSSKDGRTRIVNTLDGRFEVLEPTMLMEAGKLLFS
jgi:V/A-type H+-transporting ATPase subunit E